MTKKKKEKEKEKEKEITMSSKKKTTTIMEIPKDLMIELFLRLPVKSLLRIKWVCKSWLNLIRDPSFVYMQLNNNNNNNPLIYYSSIGYNNIKFNYYNINDDHTLLSPNSFVSKKMPSVKYSSGPIKILGSCNGLLCIAHNTCVLLSERYIIWNPCTKEYKNISRILTGTNRCYNSYGFGYDHTINDYKLVKTTLRDDRETCVYVYTLGTDSWKTARSSYEFIPCSNKEKGNINGLFISGYLYYTARKMSTRTFDMIVSFDIAKEEYQQIPIPDISMSTVLQLGELKGCLCLLSSTAVGFHQDDTVEVWMMRYKAENNIDVKEEYTWEKLYTINLEQGRWSSLSIKLLRFCKNGEILMVMVMEDWYRKNIVSYEPKSGKISKVRGDEITREENVENYVESLVSLNSGTYVSV